MNEIIITVIVAVMSSGGLVVLITKYFDKNKDKAEVHNVNVTGELRIGRAWQEYGRQMQKDLAAFRIRLDLLEVNNSDLRERVRTLEIECNALRIENTKLKQELEIYQKK